MTGMPTHPINSGNRSSVDEYLSLVDARVLTPLRSEAVQQSCSTTLLLVFAAFDALGKLTHPKNTAGPGERFRHFLSFVGTDYEQRSTELWKLRNALAHNVINVESYLSSTEHEGWTHLEMVVGSGLLYVNSRQASRDLREAFGRVKTKLATDEDAARRAASCFGSTTRRGRWMTVHLRLRRRRFSS